MTELTAPRWEIVEFDPDEDLLAPEFYEALGLDREHSCDGAGDDARLFGATNPQTRGWGPGWPNCQYDKWVTVKRDDGLRMSGHRDLAELRLMLYDETERLGYDLRPGWCWGSACRAIRGSGNPSNHSWGLADDLNAPENPMGPRNGRIRKFPAVIALWKRYGFRWGGDYAGRADDMHMEFMGTPADARAMTEKARREIGRKEDDEVTPEDLAKIEAAIDKRFDRLMTALFTKNDAEAKAISGRKGSLMDVTVDARNAALRAVAQTTPEPAEPEPLELADLAAENARFRIEAEDDLDDEAPAG